MLKFTMRKSIAEIKMSSWGRWKVKYSFPTVAVTSSCRGCSELPLEDAGSTAQLERGH